MSQTGLGVHLQDLTVVGTWSPKKREFHINILEMKAVQLALDAIKDRIVGQELVPMNNTPLVMYLKKQGRTVSLDMYRLA